MRLNEELETANVKTLQYNVEELANQLLCLERLNSCYEKKHLKMHVECIFAYDKRF